jgi:hypothetical protein
MIFTQHEINTYCLDEFVAAEYCGKPKGHDGECGEK